MFTSDAYASRPAIPLQVQLLVVDDDDVDRERVLRLLGRTELKFEAKEAASSAEALSLLREYEFDCVMLDNQLGDASGSELLPAILRESRRACPVIMITGAGSESLAVQSLQHGAADYLTKFGLNPDTLVRAIRRALDHHRLRAEFDDLHLRLEARVEQQAAAIRQSERDLRAILDHTPTVIGYWDAQLRNRFGNRAHSRWLGIDADRLPGRHLGDVLGSARLARLQPHIDAVLRGESQFFEQSFEAPDGITQRHVQLSLHPDTGDDGRVRGFYSSMHDVTPIKKAQARAEELADFNETLFEHSPVGLGVFDADGHCVMANQALARLLGGSTRALAGQALTALVTGDLLPLTATARATLADGQPRRVEVELRSVFGQDVQAACAWARVDREGRPHALLAAQDTTEQQRTHAALVAARDLAEQATRSKSEFLANMSHEIRTPMNAIVGLSQLALEDELPPDARKFIDRAHSAAQELMGILDDVLDYSKVEAGQLHFEHRPLDIEQVVQRSVDLFSARLAQKGLGFTVDLAPDLPRCVLGDPLRLAQVLNNLLGNAVKFTETGRVQLSAHPLLAGAPAPDMFRFVIRDSGIGIDPKHGGALFEAFAQGDGSITRRFGGTGLGLSICRRLVGMMHGSMGFDSSLGVGSEFWFTARLDRPSVPVPVAPVVSLDGLRVLVADPDPEQAQRWVDRLQGWQVQSQRVDLPTAVPGALAQAEAEGRAFDAVLVDEAWLAEAGLEVAPQQTGGGQRSAVVVAMVSRPSSAQGRVMQAADLALGKPVLPAALRRGLAQLRRPSSDEPSGLEADAAVGSKPAADDPSESTLDTAGQGGGQRASRPQPLEGLRLLVVEDNETNRLVAQVFLERQGAEVQVACDGEEALTRLQAGDPSAFDAVLMDLHMPVMDGLEATRRIHALPALARLPVIGMTAAVMAEDRAQCLAAGMVAHLSKPIVIEQMLKVLLHWTGRDRRAQGGRRELEIPGFDLSALRDLLHGDQQLMARMLVSFARQEADTAQQLARLVGTDDFDGACKRLHKLRGGAGTLGATAVAQTALALEQALRRRQPVRAALAAFTAALQSALAALATIDNPADSADTADSRDRPT